MQRFNSKGSDGSVGSCRGGRKKVDPTHMIVQSEVNGEVLMLPVTHLVNAAAVRLKQNDRATFKTDITGRKQERGIILLLGSQDVCSEQLEILNDDVGNASNSEKSKNLPNKAKSKTASNAVKNKTLDDRVVDQNNLDVQPKTTISAQVLQNVSRNDTQTVRQRSSSSISIIQALDVDEPVINGLDQPTMSPTDLIDEQDQENTDQSNSDVSRCSYDYLTKRHNNLLRQHCSLQLEFDRLKKENLQLKKSTIPMPDPAARQWFINVAKIFSNKSMEVDILDYARKLGIDDHKDLLGCLHDTTSNTARQIVRLLYSADKLLTMSGTEIPASQRQLIREFAEAHRGPISNHKFNEAINGVFRSKKNQKEKEEKHVAAAQRTATEKERTTDRQSAH